MKVRCAPARTAATKLTLSTFLIAPEGLCDRRIPAKRSALRCHPYGEVDLRRAQFAAAQHNSYDGL